MVDLWNAVYGQGICRFSSCGSPSLVFPRSLVVLFLGAIIGGRKVAADSRVVSNGGFRTHEWRRRSKCGSWGMSIRVEGTIRVLVFLWPGRRSVKSFFIMYSGVDAVNAYHFESGSCLLFEA